MTQRRYEPPKGRAVLCGLLLLAGVLAAVGWRTVGGAGPADDAAEAPAPPAPGAAVGAASPPGAPAAPLSRPPVVAAAPEPGRIPLRRPITDLDPETRAALQAQLDRERAADERFQQGLETSQVRARDIDARVRDAFRRVDLTPELLDGGRLRGLRVRAVEGGSALSEAGFRAGDLLVRLDGRALDDPAELPNALASAGPQLSLCAERGALEFCRELFLR